MHQSDAQHEKEAGSMFTRIKALEWVLSTRVLARECWVPARECPSSEGQYRLQHVATEKRTKQIWLNIYIWIYPCVCVNIYVYIHCFEIYENKPWYVYMRIYEYIYTYIHIYIYVRIYICIYIYIYICIYIYIHMYMYIYISYMFIIYMDVCIYTHIFLCTCMYVCVYIYIYTYIYKSMYIYIYICGPLNLSLPGSPKLLLGDCLRCHPKSITWVITSNPCFQMANLRGKTSRFSVFRHTKPQESYRPKLQDLPQDLPIFSLKSP